jgi:hypothetical protein
MLIAIYTKDPEAVLDYYIDWDPWLAGDTIVDSDWVVTTGTVTLSDPAVLGGVTQVWASGGVAGEMADLTNHITTAEGREDERTVRLKLQD